MSNEQTKGHASERLWERVGCRNCNTVFAVSPDLYSVEELAKLECPRCSCRGWVIAMPIPGTWPAECAPIYVLYFETSGPQWWKPGDDPPPLGAVVVADLISRHGGTEKDGWAWVLQCGKCEEQVIVSLRNAVPAACIECGGSLVNRYRVDPKATSPREGAIVRGNRREVRFCS